MSTIGVSFGPDFSQQADIGTVDGARLAKLVLLKESIDDPTFKGRYIEGDTPSYQITVKKSVRATKTTTFDLTNDRFTRTPTPGMTRADFVAHDAAVLPVLTELYGIQTLDCSYGSMTYVNAGNQLRCNITGATSYPIDLRQTTLYANSPLVEGLRHENTHFLPPNRLCDKPGSEWQCADDIRADTFVPKSLFTLEEIQRDAYDHAVEGGDDDATSFFQRVSRAN